MTRKIAFIESAAEMGGVQFSTLYLASHLEKTEWQPLIICAQDGDFASSSRQAGLTVLYCPLPKMMTTSLRLWQDVRIPNPIGLVWNAFAWLLGCLRLVKLLKQNPVALIITKGFSAHLYGGLAARWVKTPCLWHLQDFISERYGGLYCKIWGLLARWLPMLIVADGTPIAAQLPPKIQDRVCVVLNGVDTDIFKPVRCSTKLQKTLGLPENGVVIGNVARITPWKGQHHLVEAFARLDYQKDGLFLMLVGSPLFDNDNYLTQLKVRIEKLGLSEHVIFTGYRKDLTDLMALMDVFAYSSVEKDTSPLALLSALACGLPIVAFDLPGIREVVQDDALLVKVGDAAALAHQLQCLIYNQQLRQYLAEAARKRAVGLLSLDMYVNNMSRCFRFCIGLPETSPKETAE